MISGDGREEAGEVGQLGRIAPGSPEWALRLNELGDVDLSPRRAELIRLSEAVRGVLHRLVQTSAPVELIADAADQVERLSQVFEIIGKPARAKTCEAMQGITSEMEEDLEDFADSPAADAVLAACAQAVEHYEIARYGTLKTWARQLGHDEAAKLLDETLQEEKKADALLSKIAETINVEGTPADDDAEAPKGKAPKNAA